MQVLGNRSEVVVVDTAPDLRVVPDLRRHIPRVALDWDDEVPGRSWQVLDASMVFADISGFTALTERLATRGRIGAEELIETLNRVFGAMLSEAAIRGGELLKFGGDALLFLFRGDDHAARACRSAVDMRQALKEASKIPTSVGRLKLSMSVGIHSGPIDLFLVGSPTRELLILGSAGTATAEAEHAAVAGEILITEGTASQLPKGSTDPREDGLHRLKWRFTYPPEGEGPPTPEVPPERLRTLFPHALGEYLDDTVPDPEHKIATIGFARFSGTDAMLREQGHDAVAEVLHETLSVFEAAMIAEGVTLLATDIDSDGGKLFMGSGVPYSTEDDEGRMLRAMRHVLDVGTPLPVQIGVNRGHVFAAEVGTLERSAYSAMGDTTNTAARIMSKADAGVLFAHPSVLEASRTLFATTPAGPFPMKGKAVPVLVYDVAEEVGTRQAQQEVSGELVGRDEELAELRGVLERGLAGEGAVVTVAAATGLGKSRLITEALRGVETSVVTVRAEPYGMTSPYRMLRDPVRAAFGIERDEPDAMARALLAAMERLMPEQLPYASLLADVVQVPLEPTPEASAIEPRFRPQRVADLLVRLIETTVRGAFVLLVEEGHWADAASVAVLRRIAEAVEGRPWAVVVARRTEGEGFEPERGTRIVLEPLPADVMRRYAIDSTSDAPLREHEIDGLVARAQGNPLFLQELVRVFREVGSLDDVPESLLAALDAQVDALDPHSRRLLRYASVLGRSFRSEVLSATLAAEGLSLDDATLDKLRQFLEPDGTARLQFRNSMIRDAAYEGLAYRLRAKIHAAAGRAVESLSTDLDADADTLSLHFWRGGDDARTWRYARRAGERAAQAYANVDAAIQYERAVEAARALPDVPAADRLEVLKSLAAARELAGLYAGALDALTAANRLAKDDPYEVVGLLQHRARVHIRESSFRTALSSLSRARKLLDGDSSRQARLSRVRLGSERLGVLATQGRFRQVVQEAPPWVDEARSIDDEESLANMLTMRAVAMAMLGDHPAAEDLEEALTLSLAAGRRRGAYRVYGAMGAEALYAGRWQDALDDFLSARKVAGEMGDVVAAAQAGMNATEVLIYLGRLDEAGETIDEVCRVFRASGLPAWEVYGDLYRVRLALLEGDLERTQLLIEAIDADEEGASDPAVVQESTPLRAELLSRQGRFDEARALLERVPLSADDVALVPRWSLENARASLGLGDVDDARAHVSQGLAVAEQFTLVYEQVRLLALAAEVERAAGDADASADALRRCQALLHERGADLAPFAG